MNSRSFLQFDKTRNVTAWYFYWHLDFGRCIKYSGLSNFYIVRLH